MNQITEKLLGIVAGYQGKFDGAFNIREDGGCVARQSTEHIQITAHREGKPGLEVHVAPGTRDEKVYIPACVTKGDVDDLTYNDFYIGDGARVTIVAGCGVHTDDAGEARHNGVHRFFIGKGATVTYDEKHVGTGTGEGARRINPVTEATLEEDASLTMDTVQLGGVQSTIRKTEATLAARAKLIIRERLMTDGDETAETDFVVTLNGDDSATHVVSRSVAKGHSKQRFVSRLVGNARCSGHSECDAILADNAVVTAAPQLDAYSEDASLIHEAAIGKIAGEQVLKLRTLGLTEEQALNRIIQGFLK